MMALWRRYPGRLAHLEDYSRPLLGPGAPGDRPRIGTRWTALCGRTLDLWWDDVRGSAEHVDFDALLAETPRGWCLRCRYWSLRQALVDVGDFMEFSDLIARGGRARLVDGWDGMAHP